MRAQVHESLVLSGRRCRLHPVEHFVFQGVSHVEHVFMSKDSGKFCLPQPQKKGGTVRCCAYPEAGSPIQAPGLLSPGKAGCSSLEISVPLVAFIEWCAHHGIALDEELLSDCLGFGVSLQMVHLQDSDEDKSEVET